MTYAIKEMYYTLQGEGAQTGRAAVFLRFAGCNLWSGQDKDRRAAICSFCDTDFVGLDGPNGGKYANALQLAQKVSEVWMRGAGEHHFRHKPFVVCTGGEPAMQLDPDAVDALHAEGFEVGIETNGTMKVPAKLDWICVSPKGKSKVIINAGHELKLVYPQDEEQAQPECFTDWDFDHFFLQPMDAIDNSEQTEANIHAAADYCLRHPQWRLSLQTHKLIGLP
jgi:7-carboxy-7-deazaguanine synthase